jgi:HlyD family secretion protein
VRAFRGERIAPGLRLLHYTRAIAQLKKTLIIVGITIVATIGVIIGAGMLFGTAKNAVNGDGQPLSVRTEKAISGDLVELVSVPGEVQPEPTLKVPIAARVSARIVELPFKEWDVVTKGNPNAKPPVPASILVRLDAKDLEATMRSVRARYAAQEAQAVVTQARVESQRSTITASEVDLKDAERDLKRQKELLASKDVSQSIVDAAQTKVDGLVARLAAARHDLEASDQELVVLQHQLAAAEAEVARSQEDLNNTVIQSPIDGVVTRLRMKVGELAVVGVENNALTSIMEVADLGQMVMMARVDETNVASLKVGQRATIRLPAYRNETFEGTVTTISPSTVEQGGGGRMGWGDQMSFFEAKIRLKTDGRRIYSGLSADADIETSRHHGIRVPTQAVLGRPLDSLPDEIRKSPAVQKDKAIASVVFRLVNGKALATPVVVGPTDETHTLIKSGLEEGAEIITGPYKVLDTLQHDQKVNKQDTPAATTNPTTNPSTRPTTSPATTQSSAGS